MNTMAHLDLPPSGDHPRPISETSTASPKPVVGALPPRPAPPLETLDQTDAFPPLPASTSTSTRVVRSQSLAIKRKPLSSTASPIATRYSTRDYLDAVRRYPRPEQRFSRSCSLDSPTLYEFPERPALLPIGQLSPVDLNSAGSVASQPYVRTAPSRTIGHFAWLKLWKYQLTIPTS